MNADLKATTVTATGTVFSGPGRVKAIRWVNTATGGSIVLKDGGSGGTTTIDIATPAAAGGDDVHLPENGVRFGTDCHATLTNVSSLTIFWG